MKKFKKTYFKVTGQQKKEDFWRWEFVQKKGIELECLKDDISQDEEHTYDSHCHYNWSAEFLSNDEIKFKMTFDDPLQVSSNGDELDKLVLNIYAMEKFLVKNIQNGRKLTAY